VRNKVLVLVTLILSSACGYVTCMHVDPTKAAWSGWTAFQGSVSQNITCNFDSLSYIQLFAGAKGNGGAYHASVYDGNTLLMSSDGTQTQSEDWVKFDQWTDTVAFTKGKTLTIKFTRGGALPDSIEYYYRGDDPYKYGSMPNDIDPNPFDLCMRVYGRMDVTDSTYFAAVEVPWYLFCYSGYPGPLCFNEDTFKSRIDESKVRSVLFALSWDRVQQGGPDSWNWNMLDRTMKGIRADAGCRPLAFVGGPPVGDSGRDSWASTRYDSMDEYGGKMDFALWSSHCAPRGLGYPVTSDSNYLARVHPDVHVMAV
jgi:hypothetical protein